MSDVYTFEDQRTDEDVIFVTRRHPWVLSKGGFIGLAVIVVLVIFYLIFGFSAVTSILLIAAIILGAMYAGYLWFLYNNYLYILTNQRLIIIEQNGLFARKVTESELDKIQNVAVEVKGPIKTLLNFGNIKITTAGIDPAMVLQNVENPYVIQQKIAKYCKKLSDKSLVTPAVAGMHNRE